MCVLCVSMSSDVLWFVCLYNCLHVCDCCLMCGCFVCGVFCDAVGVCCCATVLCWHVFTRVCFCACCA